MDAKLKQLINANRVATVRLKTLSKDQQDFLVVCRHHDQPVTFPDMEKLWKQAGWGEIRENTLRRNLLAIEKDKQLLSEIYKRVGL